MTDGADNQQFQKGEGQGMFVIFFSFTGKIRRLENAGQHFFPNVLLFSAFRRPAGSIPAEK